MDPATYRVIRLGMIGAALYLIAETICELEANNPYELPAEKHRVTYALEVESGKPAAIWVAVPRLSPAATPSVVHYLDPKSGKLLSEDRFEWLQQGGLLAGAAEEAWYRKKVRIYDPLSGQLKSEASYRFTTSDTGSKFVPVNKR